MECLNIFLSFFMEPYWEVIGNILTAVGVISPVIIVVRFIHNNRNKKWQDNVSIQDHPSDYDVELSEKNAIYSSIWTETPNPCMSTIIFKPIGTVISKLKVMSLDMDGKAKKIEVFKKITPDDSICFRIERAECMPKFKLRWYTDFGDYSEHYFTENGRNGINSVEGACYKATFLSLVRRAFGLT